MESNRVVPLYRGAETKPFNLLDPKQSKILRAYGFTREEIDSATDPSLFRKLDPGQCFLVKSDSGDYVAVKLNSKNTGSGENCLVIGGIFTIFGGQHNFTIGSLLIGEAFDAVVFPIPGKIFSERERRALRHA